ncbi:hypothetical protein AB0I60_08795 [Actinosynnema sp. NPDC050436]|uniref:hypothetical protein n=1 Tax=Actinosynnema sp. NPDC050436 TaxID=3155659 RepID=UPI0033D4CCB8
MRTLAKVVAATAVALVVTAPAASADPLGGLTNTATSSGPLGVVKSVTNVLGFGLLG